MAEEQCKHERIIVWRIEETNEPAGLWSCAKCDRKFVPLEVASLPAAAVQVEPSDDGGPEQFARQAPFRKLVNEWLRETMGSVEADNVGKDQFTQLVQLAERAAGSPVQVQAGGEGGAPEGFDRWMQNPYTKVLLASIERDYVPRHPDPSPTTSGGVRVDALRRAGAAGLLPDSDVVGVDASVKGGA